MRFHDAARRRIGGTPCWEGVLAVLPSVELRPEGEGSWRVEVVVPTGDGGFAYAATLIYNLSDLADLLRMWEAGPEEALKAWWGVEVPKASVAATQVAKVEMDI